MSTFTRIAIVDADKCKPHLCKLGNNGIQPCRRICPVNLQNKECITIEKTAVISEILCLPHCGMCIKVCPYKAISIVNLPRNIETDRTHRFNNNGFILHRFIVPTRGKILGIIGQNGIGKSTILNILSGTMKPNFGIIDDEIVPDDEVKDIEDIGSNKKKVYKQFFKNSETKKFMKLVNDGKLTISHKVQHIDNILKNENSKTVDEFIVDSKGDRLTFYMTLLELTNIPLTQKLGELSGGELQRLVVALTCAKVADVYIFDEPTNYLDVKQRLLLAEAIYSLKTDDNYVIVCDHDFTTLDYIADNVFMLYGQPSVYGIASQTHNLREGLNQYLDGYITSENMRFRKNGIDFKLRNPYDYLSGRIQSTYPPMTKTFPSIEINIQGGSYAPSEIIVLLGENGTGKTTFLRLLAGQIDYDNKLETDVLPLNNKIISFKQQRLRSNNDIDMTVEQLLFKMIGSVYYDANFKDEVLNELNIHSIKDNKINKLSGGELQRVSLSICLGNVSADIYLIDEPSAFLDIEYRLIVSKMLRRYIYNHNKTAFIIEHDILMGSYLADKVIVFKKEKNVSIVTPPLTSEVGLSTFLKELNVTMRKDDQSGRPRINSFDSTKDKEQKKTGNYFE